MESSESDPSPSLLDSQIPISTDHSGGSISENIADLKLPIHIIKEASQLPIEFLEPSPDKPLIIGFDCEGVDLCRNGTLCIMQLAFEDGIYLVDAIEGGDKIMQACKPALESNYVTKVIHDCKRDSEALYFQFGIKLHNVFDTQIAYTMLEEQEGKIRLPDDYISFVGLLADPRYCGISYPEKEEVRILLRQDPLFWKHRPLTEMMIRAATDDGEIEAEILSVLEVPAGKMGRVIGKKGATILPIKQSCNAEIHMGGSKGPPDRVFIIGPVKEVRKAEAILRGKMG